MKRLKPCDRCRKPVRPFPTYHVIKFCFACARIVRVEYQRARKAARMAKTEAA